LSPDCAGRSEDEGQSNNLVDKGLHEPSAETGTGSIRRLLDTRIVSFEDSSTGMESIPSL
jgi:hypothetical protein